MKENLKIFRRQTFEKIALLKGGLRGDMSSVLCTNAREIGQFFRCQPVLHYETVFSKRLDRGGRTVNESFPTKVTRYRVIES